MYELGDLSLRILFPQSYLKLEKWHLIIRDQAQDVLSSAQRELLLCLMRDPFLVRLAEQFTITGRTKDMVSTFIKMLKQNKTKEQILDFIAMRVIIRLRPGVRVERVDDIELAVCSRVYEIVTSIWKEVEGRYKDYVIAPKPNGYRSIHTTVRHPSGFPIEVQIRTEEMHLLAEYGSASHRFYKGEIEYKQPNHPVSGKAVGSGV
jgi:(p)ppGpp synthase/HD superfamily hydrolase